MQTSNFFFLWFFVHKNFIRGDSCLFAWFYAAKFFLKKNKKIGRKLSSFTILLKIYFTDWDWSLKFLAFYKYSVWEKQLARKLTKKLCFSHIWVCTDISYGYLHYTVSSWLITVFYMFSTIYQYVSLLFSHFVSLFASSFSYSSRQETQSIIYTISLQLARNITEILQWHTTQIKNTL